MSFLHAVQSELNNESINLNKKRLFFSSRLIDKAYDSSKEVTQMLITLLYPFSLVVGVVGGYKIDQHDLIGFCASWEAVMM